MLSGIQHFVFCSRQWALIHIEHQWAENLLTVEGDLMHSRTHDASKSEKRGNVLILRDLRIASTSLGLSGACDVVEFHPDPNGVSLNRRKGLWQPYPVEYKRGKPKSHRADELQLCAQAMCLEEMLCCPTITEGSLFYGETRRRELVTLDQELRNTVADMAIQMHQLFARGHTPKIRPHKGCHSCSLKDLCLPVLCKRQSAAKWISSLLGGEKT